MSSPLIDIYLPAGFSAKINHRIIEQVLLDAAFPYARDHLAFPQLLADGLAARIAESGQSGVDDEVIERCKY